jgi:hypothetical protein
MTTFAYHSSSYLFYGPEADSLNTGKGWPQSHMKSWLFTKVPEQWLQRYLFTPDENICSCAEESEADWAYAVDLFEKVAQLPFQSTSVQE